MRSIVESNYKRFCALEGSDYIASEYALEIIVEIIDNFEVSTVLELGMGIGCITDTVLRYAHNKNLNITYFGTEANNYCIKALQNNVKKYSYLHHSLSLDQISLNRKFDLIIVDGQDPCLENLNQRCESNSIIFIEGDRKPQTSLLLSIFPNAIHVNLISLSKNKSYAHGICKESDYVGGGQLIFTNPSFKMRYFWLKNKIGTHLKRRIRKLKANEKS